MAEMGFTEYRFSIAWPRIIPDGDGEVNPLGVKHYHEVIDECLKYGIQPVVTLYHFDLPYALQENMVDGHLVNVLMISFAIVKYVSKSMVIK